MKAFLDRNYFLVIPEVLNREGRNYVHKWQESRKEVKPLGLDSFYSMCHFLHSLSYRSQR